MCHLFVLNKKGSQTQAATHLLPAGSNGIYDKENIYGQAKERKLSCTTLCILTKIPKRLTS